MAEDNKIIAAIAGLVVVVILAGSLLVPVINDAQGNEQTINNDVSGVKAVYCNPLTSETQMTITIKGQDGPGVYVDSVKVRDLDTSQGNPVMVIQTDKFSAYFDGTHMYLFYALGSQDNESFVIGPTSGERELLTITIDGFNVTFDAHWFGETNPKTEVVTWGYTIADEKTGTYANVDVRSAVGKSFSTVGNFIWGMKGSSQGVVSGVGSESLGIPAHLVQSYEVTGNITTTNGVSNIKFADTFDFNTESGLGTGAGYYITMVSPSETANFPITNIIVPLSITVGSAGITGANILVVVPVILFAAVLVGAAAWVIRNRE